MIYIDKPKSYPNKGMFSHLVASDLSELHEFAQKINLNRCWFSNKRGKNKPHYDVRKSLFDDCIAIGAILVDSKFISNFLKETYGCNG